MNDNKKSESYWKEVMDTPVSTWIHCPPSPRLGKGLPEPDQEDAQWKRETLMLCNYAVDVAVGKPTGPDPRPNLTAYNDEMQEIADKTAERVQRLIMKADHRDEDDPFAVDPDEFILVRSRYGYIIFVGRSIYLFWVNLEKAAENDLDYPELMVVAEYLREELRLCGDALFTLICYQPRIGKEREMFVSARTVKDWAENVLMKALPEAENGTGTCSPGIWCRNCRALALCRAHAATVLPEVGRIRLPLLRDAELGGNLDFVDALAKWTRAVDAYADAHELRENADILFRK